MSSEFIVTGTTVEEMGAAVLPSLSFDASQGEIIGIRDTTNNSVREIEAIYLESKFTFSERFDFLAGLRNENIKIESSNKPFFDSGIAGSTNMYPNRYVLEAILGLPRGTFGDPFQEGTPFPDEDLAFYQSQVDGEIDENKLLPNLGFIYRPVDAMAFRLNWSQTVARPSFREVGYYVSTQPGSNDLVVGNPALELSDVESLDFRWEYSWGGRGDLVAFSLFNKKIDKPIESILIRDRGDFNDPTQFQTFFNNNNSADLNGIEFEVRKNLDFLGSDFMSYFSLGGNMTLIDAEVKRSDQELEGTDAFFGAVEGESTRFNSIEETRRLFGQPEWITNFDVTFDHPDWGMRATLAFFAISDVLDSAGSVNVNFNDEPVSMTLDRYVASYDQIDLIFSQEWKGWTFKVTIKNLTDTSRAIIYDPEQVSGEIQETEFKIGRDYSLSASYVF